GQHFLYHLFFQSQRFNLRLLLRIAGVEITHFLRVLVSFGHFFDQGVHFVFCRLQIVRFNDGVHQQTNQYTLLRLIFEQFSRQTAWVHVLGATELLNRLTTQTINFLVDQSRRNIYAVGCDQTINHLLLGGVTQGAGQFAFHVFTDFYFESVQISRFNTERLEEFFVQFRQLSFLNRVHSHFELSGFT